MGCTVGGVANQPCAGTEVGETITVTAGADIIQGLGGNDVIDGLGGDDMLCGEEGNNRLMEGEVTTL
jgi:hypothetical protein